MRKALWIAGVVLLAGAISGGCAGGCAQSNPKWVKPGGTPEELNAAQDDCMAKATLNANPGSIDPNERAMVQRDYRQCMEGKGYTSMQGVPNDAP